MSGAWTGDWKARINDFVRRYGCDSVWQYLQKHPTTSFLDMAKSIGDAAAIQIQGIVVEHCMEHGLLGEFVRDAIVRGVHSALPSGWNNLKDRRFSVSGNTANLPSPYSDLVQGLMTDLLRHNPPPTGWLPTSKDDPVLKAAYDRALDSLSQPMREMVARGEYIRPPGSIYASAIEPIWKSISIYDGPEVFLEGFSRVRPELGSLFAAHWCQSEICNGGFHQFFGNPTGVLAPEAAAGFHALGMPNCSGIIGEAVDFFGTPYPRDREERWQRIQPVAGKRREEWDPFSDLDRRFYKHLRSENGGFVAAADRYAESIR
jgi:hypothetical protein